jgi:hypothetical protein
MIYRIGVNVYVFFFFFLLIFLFFYLQNGLHWAPTIFLHKVPVGQVNKLSKIVLEHGGKVVSSEDNASHIVDWNDDIDANQVISEDANRLVKIFGEAEAIGGVGSVAQVHWSFFPDSYDELFPVEVIGNDTTDVQNLLTGYSLKTRYYVSCRYIFDCDVFNEWGNEIDYEHSPSDEDDNQLMDAGSSKRLKSKRKSNAGVSTINKKDAFIPQAVNGCFPVSSDKVFFPEILPKSLTNNPSISSSALDITTNPPILFESSQPVESKHDDASILGKRSLEFTSVNNDANWYSAERISDLETRYLGYLMQDTTTSSFSSYITIRNSIVSFYLQNPSQYLTATECRRKVAGDISKIVRTHEFLDAFGVINHLVKLEQRPVYGFEVLDEMSKSLKKKNLLEKISNHYPTYAISQSISKQPSPTGDWTVEMDSMLLSLISSRKKDWRSIASEMGRMFSVSLVQCMMRFLEMPMSVKGSLLETSGDDKTITSMSNHDISPKGISTCKDEMCAKLQQALESIQGFEKLACASKLQVSCKKHMIDVIPLCKPFFLQPYAEIDSHEESANTSQINVSVMENISAQIKEELKQHLISQIRSISEMVGEKVQDYTSLRLQMLENKLTAFEHVENAIILEKEQLEAEKHDFLMTKLSHGNAPVIPSIPPSSSFSNFSTIK